jgi:hypothetical protein
VTPLPAPEVVGCYFDIGLVPPIAAMVLRWPEPLGSAARGWALPGGEMIQGSPPRRFAARLRRQAEDAYHLALVWDSTYRQWFSLRREELLGCAVEPVLAALGTALAQLLDQPVGGPERALTGAA